MPQGALLHLTLPLSRGNHKKSEKLFHYTAKRGSSHSARAVSARLPSYRASMSQDPPHTVDRFLIGPCDCRLPSRDYYDAPFTTVMTNMTRGHVTLEGRK